MDEWAIYQNDRFLKAEADSGNEIFSHYTRRVYELQDFEGFRAIFGEDEPIVIEPESDKPF